MTFKLIGPQPGNTIYLSTSYTCTQKDTLTTKLQGKTFTEIVYAKHSYFQYYFWCWWALILCVTHPQCDDPALMRSMVSSAACSPQCPHPVPSSSPCSGPLPTPSWELSPHRLPGHSPTPSSHPGATHLDSFTSLFLSLGPNPMLSLFPKSCLFYMDYNSKRFYHGPIEAGGES